MSCSKNTALQQVERLSGLDFYPRPGPGRYELLEALERTARDDADAKRIISDWIAGNSIAPKPSELRAMKRRDDFALPPRFVAPPSPRHSGFVDRGEEYLDEHWQVFAAEMTFPPTREFYNAFWHEPQHAMRAFGGAVVAWPFLTPAERAKVERHFRAPEPPEAES